jgi:serine-type D-Ala-D-Ala carboxypeptidase (penicillin-binding protein 5/6)
MTATDSRLRTVFNWCVVIAIVLVALPDARSASAAIAFNVSLPDVTAAAVYSIDATAGVELMAKDADERRSPASTTKIASAIVVVDNIDDLNQQVTIEQSDIAPLASDESRVGLQSGDVLTIRQLLEGMLVQSGSDATYAAARVTGTILLGGDGGDPIEAFIEEMNAVVKQLKLKNTRFMNPVGIDQERHYSSAHDLARLAEYALDSPVIAEIVAQSSIPTVIEGPNRREVTLQNTNTMLDGGAIHGVKTGSTTEAGACLILAKWENGTNRVITVVLGSRLSYDDQGYISDDKRWDDTEAILGAIESDVRWISPSDEKDVPGLIQELAAWQVALKNETSIVVPADEVKALRYLLQLGPAGDANTEVGRVLFFVGSEQIAQVPVYQTPIS